MPATGHASESPLHPRAAPDPKWKVTSMLNGATPIMDYVVVELAAGELVMDCKSMDVGLSVTNVMLVRGHLELAFRGLFIGPVNALIQGRPAGCTQPPFRLEKTFEFTGSTIGSPTEVKIHLRLNVEIDGVAAKEIGVLAEKAFNAVSVARVIRVTTSLCPYITESVLQVYAQESS